METTKCNRLVTDFIALGQSPIYHLKYGKGSDRTRPLLEIAADSNFILTRAL